MSPSRALTSRTVALLSLSSRPAPVDNNLSITFTTDAVHRPLIATYLHINLTMNSYISWAIFLAVLGGLSWHYAGRPTLLTRFGSQKTSEESSQQASGGSTRKPKAKAKPGRDRDNGQKDTKPANQLPSTASNVSKKRKIAAPQVSRSANALSSRPGEVTNPDATNLDANKDGANNADFAREMAVARAGTQFAASGKPGMSRKERRGQKLDSLRPGNDTDSPSLSTGASSTTGGDADDDLSPVVSPALAATSTAATSKSGDVSDMLESSSAGPAILRLTEPTNPMPTAKAKQAAKAFEPAETKKQRQQRIKRETRRQENEEAETERRKLMEKQIRGARMAEGTSAQTRTSAFKPATGNAWFSSPSEPSTEATKAPAAEPQSLLDTFEPEARPTESSTKEAGKAPLSSIGVNDFSTPSSRSSAAVAKENGSDRSANVSAFSGKEKKDWAKDLPVEEEQLRLVQDSEGSWTTVSKRDKKKTSKANGSKEVDTSEASGVESRHANGAASNAAASSGTVLSSNFNSYHQLGDSGFQDSEWAA